MITNTTWINTSGEVETQLHKMRTQAQISPDSLWSFDLFSWLPSGLGSWFRTVIQTKCRIIFHSALHIFYGFVLFLFLFWTHLMACGVLVPQPGIEPGPLSVKAQSPNHWTAREFPIFKLCTCCLSTPCRNDTMNRMMLAQCLEMTADACTFIRHDFKSENG